MSALTCNFTVKCSHTCCNGAMVDYTSCVVKDILIAGIADTDIRKELLGITNLDDKNGQICVNLSKFDRFFVISFAVRHIF